MSEVKGKIVIIKRSGQDRVSYPLVSDSCLFGSGLDCDIRVQLPSVSERHCVLKVGPKDKVYLTSFSHDNITLLNNIPVSGTVPVNHKDILTVVDRCFRFEYTPDSAYYVEDDSSVSVPDVKSLKVLSPREKPPLFQVNGIPGKTSSVKKKLLRKSLGADIRIFSSELSPLSRPRTPYLKKNSTSPRSMSLSSSKHKRVSFGPALSPEQFDKNMPPATPVRRGSLPRRHATTPDYFGSPIITQYPRLKKKRLSAIPKEQSIAEEVVETSEAVSQSPKNKYNAVSPKSRSPSAASKSSPKTKGSPIQMLQQTPNKKAGDVTRKSPLAKKSPKSASQSPVSKTSKSVSPVQSPISSAGKGKMNRGDADTEVAVSLSSSLSDSPQQTVTNAKKVSPFKSKHNTPKQKASPSNLSPVEVWSSVISPSTKQASPLSRRKSSIHSSANLSSLAVTPRRSLKTGVINERGSSSGKRSSSSHAVKRLSSGKSPARPVSLSTANQKSPLKTKKQISRASEVRYSLPPASQSLAKESSLSEKLSTDDFSSALMSDSAENSSFHVITPKSSLNRQLNHKKLSSSKVSPGSRILKRLSAGKSPAHSPSPSTPIRRASGKLSENKKSSSKLSQSFLFMSASPMKEVFKNETSQSEDHLDEAGKNDADTTWSPFSDQDSTQSPVSRGRRSGSRATPKSSGKRQSSVKQSLVIDTFLTPESGIKDVSETPDAKQVTPVGTSRMSRSPVASKSMRKSVSSAFKETPGSASKTPVSKRKADFSLSPESVKKTRLSASPSSKLSTPSSKTSPKSQSLVEARSMTSPKELLSKPISATPVKKSHSPSPKPKASADKTQGKTKSLSPNSKNKTPVKISPQMKSSPSLSKENAKTPVSKNAARSKVTPSSVKTRLETSARASPLAKSPSSAAKLKFSTPAKKVTPITKRSSVKKVAPTSRSLKKSVVVSSPSQLVKSPARSVRKVFSIKKSSKKPMWTEIVRRGIMKKKVTSKPKVVRSLLSNAVKTKKAFKSSNKKQVPKAIPASNKTIFAQIASVTSTGHAESPETIVIRKRSTLPKPSTRDMGNLQSPSPDSSIATNIIDTSSKLNLSHSSVKSRKSLSSSAAKTSIGRQKGSPDISSISTPNISQETFVSPLTTPRVPRKNNSYLEKYVQENQHEAKTVSVKSSRKSFMGVKRLLKSGTPKADYSNVAGIKRLVHTPRASPKPDYRDVRGIKKLVQTSKDTPKADYRDVRGVRRLVQTPKDSPKADYRDVRGIRRLVQTPKDSPKADYRDVRGIKRLVRTPKDSPVADYRDVDGVKDLLTTPASAKRSVSQAKTGGLKQLYQNHTPLADYTKVKGVKQLFKATRPVKGKARARKTKDGEIVREPDFTNVEGVKQLFREPEENEFNISGLQQLFSPVPSVPFSAKTGIVSPTAQDASPLIQKISSPRSRRKQSFGSSPAFNTDDSKKPLQITSVPQRDASAADRVIDMEAVVISPSTVKEVPGKTLGSANKAVRSTRSTTAIPVHEQTPDPLHSPSGRKSVGTAMPLDTSLSGKSPKVNKPGKSVTSPLQPAMTTRTPSMSSPKTRQQTPQSATDETHDRKNSLLQKQRRVAGREEKSDAEVDKIASPSAVPSVLPVSTSQRAKRGRKNDNVNRTPEIIVISDDEDEVALSEQNPKRGGRSNSKQAAVADKGSKKGVDQEVSDLVESQQAVRQITPRKNSRAVRGQTIPAAETSVANEAVPNDLSGGRRATRSKTSEVKKMVGSQHATGAIAPKGGRGTRSKKINAAADEVPEYIEETSDSHDVGGRASRRKMVVSPEPVDQSSPAVVVSPTKVDKRNKTKKFLETETKEDSLHFSGDENNEVNEVKGSRRTRGKGQAVVTPVKRTASKSVVPSADENKAGRVTRRGGAAQTTTRQNVRPKADSLESRVEDSIADIKALPPQGNLSTTPSRRRVNKQKQDNSTSSVIEMLVSSEHNEAVADTPSPAKSFKTRKNRKLPARSEDSQDAPSKTDYEAVAASEKSKRSKTKMLCKSDDTSQVAESVKGNANVPSMSKEPRSRRNQKVSQEDVTPSSLQEDGETLMGTRRSKRGRQQETETVPQVMPKQPRTRDQKYVSSAESSSASIDSTDMSDAVPRTTRGKTVKSDTSCESTEVPDARRPKKQSKKSNVNKEDGTTTQRAANKTASVSSKKHAVGSPSSQNVVKKGQLNVDEVPPESERPKRVGRATRGVTSISSDNDAEAVNSKRSRAKRSAVDSANDAVSPKRTRKTVTQKGVSAIEETTRTAKVQPKPSKTQAPVLEAIPEVEEEIAVTPTVKKVTRAKASVKETTKKSPLRRPTRSRRK